MEACNDDHLKPWALLERPMDTSVGVSRVGSRILDAPGRASSRSIGGLAPWQLRRAKDVLADWAKRPSLADLARPCGISPAHFSRAFKATTGKTPTTWLTEQRIGRAVDLVRDSAMPLAEIAINCGFADQAHFTRTFTRLKGQSPAVWRKVNRRP